MSDPARGACDRCSYPDRMKNLDWFFVGHVPHQVVLCEQCANSLKHLCILVERLPDGRGRAEVHAENSCYFCKEKRE